MAVDLTYLTDVASEFATVDSARVDRLVVIASARCPDTVWTNPVTRDLGIAYLVAHMLKVDALRGQGAVTSESIGDLSRSYAAPSSSTDDGALEQTGYGREFKKLQRAQPRGVVVT